eukprot:superscaffoldBa00000150_g2161
MARQLSKTTREADQMTRQMSETTRETEETAGQMIRTSLEANQMTGQMSETTLQVNQMPGQDWSPVVGVHDRSPATGNKTGVQQLGVVAADHTVKWGGAADTHSEESGIWSPDSPANSMREEER